MGRESGVQDLRSKISSLNISSNPAASIIDKNNKVGFDDDMMEIKKRLTKGSSNLETVSLVGMGGIDKSTLATKVYEDEYIEENNKKLAEVLYKGRKYLIIMDDVWIPRFGMT
ncbi:late blight resistance homolog R1B-8 [Olea europaea subsp. europaea]|uniref:Late blight resistance homolog R1B-8 n=1 Tax=Olea europaea subsp. europaea TaxID=158383 RepID=A0A8S0R5V5_OLEEU|nr:late blight resistance homolog R1B-8 [Olea europaea subsp. europaea]